MINKTIELRRKKRTIAEGLYALYIKIRDGYTCRRCGNNICVMEASHFITRGNKKVQFHLDNGFTLCKYKCHGGWAHKEKREFEEWVTNELGEARYDALIQQSNQVWKETIEFYDDKIKLFRSLINEHRN